MAYFLIKDISKTKGKSFTVKGDLVVETEIEYENNDPDVMAQALPKPKIPKPRELKWILPPKGSNFGDGTGAYKRSKEFAEAAGYETVEHDDVTYPGPRF